MVTIAPRRDIAIAILTILWPCAVHAQTFTVVDQGFIVNDGGATVSASWGDYDNDGDEGHEWMPLGRRGQ